MVACFLGEYEMHISGSIRVTLKSEFLPFLTRVANNLTQSTMNFGELVFDVDELLNIPEHKVRSVVYEFFVFDGPKHIYRRRQTSKLAELSGDLSLIRKRDFPAEWYSKQATTISPLAQATHSHITFNEGTWPPTY